MTSNHELVRTVSAVAGGIAVAGILMLLTRKKSLADRTVAQIEDSIVALDPLSRAAVLARLGVDATGHVKERLGH